MKFNILISKYIHYVLIILLFVITVIVTIYASLNCNFLFGDDNFYSLYSDYSEKIYDCLKFGIHGNGYIGYFLSKFFSFGLPNILGIHPADFIGWGHGAIKGFFTAGILLLIANWGCFYYKSKILYVILYASVILYFFLIVSESAVMMSYYTYYRYFFSMLFWCIFWYYIAKNIVIKSKHINYFYLISVSICGFIIGTSIEINIFSSLLCASFLIVYSFFINKFIKDKQKIKSLKIFLDRRFYIPVFFLFLGAFLFILNSGWFHVASDLRGLGKTTLTISLVLEYIKSYYEILIKNYNMFFYIFISIYITTIYFAIKKKEIKKIIFINFYLISLYAVLFSLVLLGKTSYDNDFWIYHNNIIFLYKISLAAVFLCYFSYLMKNIININIVKKLKKQIIVILFLFSIILIKPVYNIIQADISIIDNECLYQWKCKAYIMEKILRFYYLKNLVPILPKQEIMSWYFDSWRNNSYEEKEFYTENLITDSYYPRIYKDNKSRKLGYKLSDNAINIFYKNGGVFSEEELQNIKFQRLLNNDFILNKNKTPQNIKQILSKEI